MFVLAQCLSTIGSPAHKWWFRHVFNRYSAFIYEVAFRILKNEKDAEDAAQETLLAIAGNAERILPLDERSLKNYVAVVARNKALDIYKQRKKNEDLSELLKDQTKLLSDRIPLDNTLARAIARLPQEQRTLIVLHYSNGYTTAELAQMLDISQSAVRKRLQRAKEALRQALEKEGITV